MPEYDNYFSNQIPGLNPAMGNYGFTGNYEILQPTSVDMGGGFSTPDMAPVIPDMAPAGMSQLSGGVAALGTAVDIAGNISSLANSDATSSIPSQYYANPYSKPPEFIDPENPYQKGVGAARALEYGSKGASAGMMIGGPIGAGIGAGVGVIAGGVEGAINSKKRMEFEKGVRDEKELYLDSLGDYQSNQDKRMRELQQSLYNQRRMQSTYIPPNSLY